MFDFSKGKSLFSILVGDWGRYFAMIADQSSMVLWVRFLSDGSSVAIALGIEPSQNFSLPAYYLCLMAINTQSASGHPVGCANLQNLSNPCSKEAELWLWLTTQC